MPTIADRRTGRSVSYTSSNYSFVGITRSALANPQAGYAPSGLEGEVSAALECDLDPARDRGGFSVPLDALGLRKRSLDTSNAAGFTSPKIVGPMEFTDVMRSKAAAGFLGVRFASLQGGNRPVSIPTKSSASAVAWIAEGAPAPAGYPTFLTDPDGFETKTLAAQMIVDRRVWKSSDEAVHDYLVADLAAGFAAEVDKAIAAGAGELDPFGVLNLEDVPVMAFGTNGGPPTRAALVAAMKAVHKANGDASTTASMGWLTSPDGEAKLRTVDGSAAGSGAWLWSDSDRILGKPAVATTAVPANLTKGSGSGLTALVYGNWGDVLVNHAPSAQIVIDPFTQADGNAVRILAFLDVRILFRHAASFVVFKDMVAAA